MALDCGRRAFHGAALNHVGIDCALGKPAGALYFLGFSIEHLHKVSSDNLALLLRVGHAFKVGIEAIACVNADNVKTHVLVRIEHFVKLILAEQAVVYEYASQIGPYGFVKEHGGHR